MGNQAREAKSLAKLQSQVAEPGPSGLCSAVSKDDDRGERGLGLERPADFKQVERE